MLGELGCGEAAAPGFEVVFAGLAGEVPNCIGEVLAVVVDREGGAGVEALEGGGEAEEGCEDEDGKEKGEHVFVLDFLEF